MAWLSRHFWGQTVYSFYCNGASTSWSFVRFIYWNSLSLPFIIPTWLRQILFWSTIPRRTRLRPWYVALVVARVRRLTLYMQPAILIASLYRFMQYRCLGRNFGFTIGVFLAFRQQDMKWHWLVSSLCLVRNAFGRVPWQHVANPSIIWFREQRRRIMSSSLMECTL